MAATAWFKAEKKKLLNEGYAAAVANSGANTERNIIEIPTGTYDNPGSRWYSAEATLSGHSYSPSWHSDSTMTINGYTYKLCEGYGASSHSSGTLDISWSTGTD